MPLISIAQRLALTGIALSVVLTGCDRAPEPSEVSEAPTPIPADSRVTTRTHSSRIGIRTRITYDDIKQLIRADLPAHHADVGERRICKKVIGIKICGTAEWQYTVQRGDDITVSGLADTVSIALPLTFAGEAGIQGDVARALQLSSVDFDGAINTTINLGMALDADWCPQLQTTIDYQWIKKPRVRWAKSIKFDIQKHLDEAIAEQLKDLPQKLAERIDCEEFRSQLSENWRNHHIPLDIEGQDQLHLNLSPTGFAFSGLQTDAEALGVTFELQAQTTVTGQAVAETPQPLPAVNKVDYTPGQTEFELLVYSSYERLQKLAMPQLVGKTFHSKSPAGEVATSIKSIDITGSANGVTFGIEFEADLPRTRHNATGTLYLNATPVVDPATHKITLTNLSITRILDNQLWQALSAVFENKIIAAIEQNAVIDLSDQIVELEAEIRKQLSNPENTSGVSVDAQNLSIQLGSITPEGDGLAILITAHMTLDLLLPHTLLTRTY